MRHSEAGGESAQWRRWRKHSAMIVLALLLSGCGIPLAPAPPTSAPPPTATLPQTPPPVDSAAGMVTLVPLSTPSPPPPPTSTAPPPPPTSIPPTPPPPPTPTPPPPIAGYRAYLVAPGDTLENLAARGGSSADLIGHYNQIPALPPVGCPLIVPYQAGQSRTLPQSPLLVERGCTSRPWVALTLDAGGESAPTPAMLEALRQRNIHITFFLTGRWIAENPDLTRQIVADGHAVANHSHTHADFTTLSAEQMRAELAETERLFREVTGGEATMQPFFRPPYGAYNREVLLVAIEAGYLPIYWTLDSLDSYGEPKTAQFLIERVTGALSPDALRGAIILAHCGSAATAEALPAMLDRLMAMGFEVRPLRDVLRE